MTRTAPVPSQPYSPFRGHVEHFANGVISGWALDVRPQARPVRLHVLIDRQEVLQITCNQSRQDVQNILEAENEQLGFSFCLPDSFFDNKPHQVALRFADRSILPFPDPENPNNLIETTLFPGFTKPEYRSFVDSIDGDTLRGWVIKRLKPHKPWIGNLVVEASVDGRYLQTVRADFYRTDVAQSLGCDPACGFEIILPQQLRDQQPHRFQLTLIPDKIELEGSPLNTTLVDDALEARLVVLEKVISDMHVQLTSLRREIHNLIPKRPFNLRHYDQWARIYYTKLREKIATQHIADPLRKTPLISILCPVWRPLAQDFEAAVTSVLMQTYPHWELLLIDDGSKCATTTTIIKRFCKQDSRIRVITLPQNKGISSATNAGIKAANGTYIAFFDHDDLLVDVALDVMVRIALKTGAKLLYSDEDKIDSSGHFSEPNLKPDYNYRYLLGCNYICHLTMIDTRIATTIGALNSRYDGAQDHDFLLRAVEILPETAIYHVREILYHWRKTENSTASNINNKAYAIKAGVNCVSAHLKRQKRPANVEAINNISLYAIHWRTKTCPSVSIIIPFRDQYDTTRSCVEHLLQNLAYPNFQIILVDNFSIEEETLTFLETLKDNPHVTILRVEENFNYSRLNNLAAAQSNSEFLLFLNNDVFITQKNFLNLMVKEAVSVPHTAIVGACLLYPNKTIQHAGVAVGPEVVGVHTHRAQSNEDYGYIGRICLSHEVTAVTAAAMLIRRKIFDSVGGFDEQSLGIAYNDVDLCLKVRNEGWHIVYCAEAYAEHHESLTRGSDDRPEHEARFFHETQTMKERWHGNAFFEQDPAYPRYFTLERQTFFDLRNPDIL